MRSKIIAIVTFLSLMTLGFPAQAETFTSAKNTAMMIQLEAMEGRISPVNLVDLRDVNALKARIVFDRIGTDLINGSIFSLRLVGFDNDGEDNSAGIWVEAQEEGGPLRLLVQAIHDGKIASSKFVLSAPFHREPFDVILAWTPGGQIEVRIHADHQDVGQFERHVVELGLPVQRVVLVANAATVGIEKLELGNIEP